MKKELKIPFDYKKIISEIKSFDYRNPEAYKNLLKNEKFRRGFIYFLTFVLLFTLIRSCLHRPHKKEISARPVETSLVIKKDAPIYIDSFGTLTAINDVDIKSQVTGKILEVHFQEGDEVAKGDLLFTIDPQEYQSKLEKARASVEEDAASLKLTRDTLDRNKPLVEKDLLSKQDFETYEKEVAVAVAQVSLDLAEMKYAEINLGYCYISSPIDGVTGKRLVDPGNIVPANTGSTLVNIKSVDPFYLDFTISEKDLPRVRDAMAARKLNVEINPEGDDKGPYEGELIFIDNAVDDLTGTVALRALVNNNERKLWAGQFVLIRLILNIKKDATLAPFEAIAVGQKGSYLFVVTKDNKADVRILTLGERQEDYIIVEKGVSPGEKVVTTGQLGLAPGIPVKETEKTEEADAKKDKK